MERIVITGATGFLGRNLAALFLEKGYEVFAVVRPQSANLRLLPTHPNLHVVQAPLEQTSQWERRLAMPTAFSISPGQGSTGRRSILPRYRPATWLCP